MATELLKKIKRLFGLGIPKSPCGTGIFARVWGVLTVQGASVMGRMPMPQRTPWGLL